MAAHCPKGKYMDHILVVDGKNVTVRGRVEFNGATLSVPSNRSTRRLASSLAPRVERGENKHVVSLDGKPLPSSFLLSFRAPSRVIPEG